MSTRHLVDPDLLPLLDLLPPFEVSDALLPVFRARSAEMVVPLETGAPDLVMAPGPAGAPDVALRIFRPADAKRSMPAILHIHGGGYILGAAALNDAGNRRRADALGAVVVSVDYRLAPEHPYPAPQEDCYAGLRWLAVKAEALGVDPARIVTLGESAGGGLAAALALLARDRSGPALAGQFLVYPMLNMRTGADLSPASEYPAGEFIWTAASNRYGWAALRGAAREDDAGIGYLSPALAADLRGLPAAFVATGALDLFRDEDLDYAKRLAHAGVPTEFHMYPGAMHGFDLMADADVSRRFERDLLTALERRLAPA